MVVMALISSVVVAHCDKDGFGRVRDVLDPAGG
jgi:hypothetical protein